MQHSAGRLVPAVGSGNLKPDRGVKSGADACVSIRTDKEEPSQEEFLPEALESV
jgi:hypothetical protein